MVGQWSEMSGHFTVDDLNILYSQSLFGMEGIECFCQQWLIAISSFLSGREKTSNSGFPFPEYIINMSWLSPTLLHCSKAVFLLFPWCLCWVVWVELQSLKSFLPTFLPHLTEFYELFLTESHRRKTVPEWPLCTKQWIILSKKDKHYQSISFI